MIMNDDKIIVKIPNTVTNYNKKGENLCLLPVFLYQVMSNREWMCFIYISMGYLGLYKQIHKQNISSAAFIFQ